MASDRVRAASGDKPSATFARLFLGLAFLSALACSPVERSGRSGGSAPPILLITVEGLRADQLSTCGGPSGHTPELDRFVADGATAYCAVASSSRPRPALASLLTGLRPWQHGAIEPFGGALGAAFITLPEALGALGYRSLGFRHPGSLDAASGLLQGLERAALLPADEPLRQALAEVAERPTLVWIHLTTPTAPYLRRDPFLDPAEIRGKGLPRRIGVRDVAPYFDPANELPEEMADRIRALYRSEVAAVDAQIGGFLDLLGEVDVDGDALVAVAGTHGQELGEHGQILEGGNLGRSLVEVPLLVRLPRSRPRSLAVAPGSRVAARRLWATLVEAAGGEAPPAVAPSLFRDAPREALSELYAAAHANLFSLVDGEDRLLWTARFAAGDRPYFRAWLSQLGVQTQPPLRRPPQEIFARYEQAFLTAPALVGDPRWPVVTRLERWGPEGSTPVEDAVKEQALALRLEELWQAWSGDRVEPAERLRHLPR